MLAGARVPRANRINEWPGSNTFIWTSLVQRCGCGLPTPSLGRSRSAGAHHILLARERLGCTPLVKGRFRKRWTWSGVADTTIAPAVLSTRACNPISCSRKSASAQIAKRRLSRSLSTKHLGNTRLVDLSRSKATRRSASPPPQSVTGPLRAYWRAKVAD